MVPLGAPLTQLYPACRLAYRAHHTHPSVCVWASTRYTSAELHSSPRPKGPYERTLPLRASIASYGLYKWSPPRTPVVRTGVETQWKKREMGNLGSPRCSMRVGGSFGSVRALACSPMLKCSRSRSAGVIRGWPNNEKTCPPDSTPATLCC